MFMLLGFFECFSEEEIFHKMDQTTLSFEVVYQCAELQVHHDLFCVLYLNIFPTLCYLVLSYYYRTVITINTEITCLF